MSSFVMVSPEVLSAASSDMSGIGSAVRSAHAFAAGSTTSVLAAAGDEVSAAVSELFDGYAREYQAVAAQAKERLLSELEDDYRRMILRQADEREEALRDRWTDTG